MSFQNWEEEFSRCLNSLQRKLASFPTQTKESKEAALSEGFQELSEAEKCLRQMDFELTMMKQTERLHLQAQVRRYREDFERVKREFRSEETKYTDLKGKETLMGARLEVSEGTHGQKQKLLQTNALMHDQMQRIEQGKRTALECEGIAIETMKNLQANREIIEKATRNNRDIGDDLSKGNRLLNVMTRRSVTNKLMLLGVGALLLVGIGCVVYFKFS